MGSDELSRVRIEIGDIDREIVELASRRARLAEKLGALKRQTGSPIRDYAHAAT